MATSVAAPKEQQRTRSNHRVTVKSQRQQPNRAGWGLIGPFLVLYLAFLLGPTIYGFIISLFDTSLVRPGLSKFVGLGNYIEAFQSSDFWSSMWHTVWFTILTTPPLVVLALVMAVLADRAARLKWFYRVVFFAPYVVPVSVATLVWTWLYAPQIGLLGTWMTKIGLTAPNWLADPNWAMVSVAIMTVWWTLGFNFILYLAGLQEVPRELYEAASVDGASSWRQLRSITLPLLGRTTALVTVLQILASLKIFDQIYLLTLGGPNYSTRPVLEYVYDLGFTDFRVGYASACSMVLFVITVLVSLLWMLNINRQNKGAQR